MISIRRKSRNFTAKEKISTTDEVDRSPTSVGSHVISVSSSAELESGNNGEMALDIMDSCIDIVGRGDLVVPMNDGSDDFEIPVQVDYEYEDAAPDDRSKYGYGDAAPDDKAKYGYGDAAPDDRSKYGYGDATPDEKSDFGYHNIDVAKNAAHGDFEVPVQVDYGYGYAAPDDRSKYGYGDAAPDDRSKYGYGDAAPDDRSKYGYGDAAPDVKSRRPRGRVRRRKTCGDDDDEDDMSCESSPSAASTDSTMRSAMKKHGAPRRASIQMGGEISVYLPGQRRTVRRRTSITFNESVKVKQVPSVRTLTDAPERLWFQDDEFKAIRRRSLDLLDKVDKGRTEGKKYCIRGLEKMLKGQRKKVMAHKHNAWDTVLDEQDVQRDSGTWDEEYMANVYKYITSKPKEDAVLQGQKDYADIENYMRSTRKVCRRLSM